MRNDDVNANQGRKERSNFKPKAKYNGDESRTYICTRPLLSP